MPSRRKHHILHLLGIYTYRKEEKVCMKKGQGWRPSLLHLILSRSHWQSFWNSFWRALRNYKRHDFLGFAPVLLSLQLANESWGLRHSTHIDLVNFLSVHFVPSTMMTGAGVIKMNEPTFLLWRCFQLKVMSKVDQKALASSENLNPKSPSPHNNPRVKPLQGIWLLKKKNA